MFAGVNAVKNLGLARILRGCFLQKRTWAQASGRTHAPMQFVVAVGFATLRCSLLRALYFLDSVDFLMVCAICCAPPLGWSRLMLIPMLNTSDRTRTTWATVRQAGLQHFAGFNPRPPSIYRMQSRDSRSQVPGLSRWYRQMVTNAGAPSFAYLAKGGYDDGIFNG